MEEISEEFKKQARVAFGNVCVDVAAIKISHTTSSYAEPSTLPRGSEHVTLQRGAEWKFKDSQTGEHTASARLACTFESIIVALPPEET